MKRTEEDSRYEGPPIVQPRTPYQVDYEPRKVDKELKFIKRAGQKLMFVGEDFFEYVKDPI